jgi:hypothetical protein
MVKVCMDIYEMFPLNCQRTEALNLDPKPQAQQTLRADASLL